jgi:hypothetical protein
MLILKEEEEGEEEEEKKEKGAGKGGEREIGGREEGEEREKKVLSFLIHRVFMKTLPQKRYNGLGGQNKELCKSYLAIYFIQSWRKMSYVN